MVSKAIPDRSDDVEQTTKQSESVLVVCIWNSLNVHSTGGDLLYVMDMSKCVYIF